MTDDDTKQGGLAAPPETSGFVEPETPPVANGRDPHHSPALVRWKPDAEAPSEGGYLATIVNSEAFPDALRVTADRVLKIEAAFRQLQEAWPSEFSVGEALTQFRAELQQMSQVVTQLSQERAVQEFLAERNARATALDLAIKALPEADRTPDAIVAHAEAYLGWLKSGTQA
jgi:hypothetical protein